MTVTEQIRKRIAKECSKLVIGADSRVAFQIITPWTQIPEHVSAPAIGRWQLQETEKQDEHCSWWLTYSNVEVPKTPIYGIGVKTINGDHEVQLARSKNRDAVLTLIDGLNIASGQAFWSAHTDVFYLKEVCI